MKAQLTKQALNSLDEIYNYILKDFGVNKLIEFENEVWNQIGLIEKKVVTGIVFNENCHRLIVHKHTSLFYHWKNDVLYILDFWNHRNNNNELNSVLTF